MTTLNQAFIRVSSRQSADVSDGNGSQVSGPRGVQLRVDAGAVVSGSGLAGTFSSMKPIHTATVAGKTLTAIESEMQIVTSDQSLPLPDKSDCLVSMSSPDPSATGNRSSTSEFYAATCVDAPLLSDQVQWPPVCCALTQAAADSLEGAGRTLAQAVAEGMKTIAVTSADAAVGVTTMAICLARATAQQGVRVALVDAHFSDPRLAVEMGLEHPSSWFRRMHKQAAGSSSMPLEKEGVTFYPLEIEAPDGLTDWTRSPLASSLDEISQGHELVLLDVGPVLVAWGYGFRRIAAEMVDAVVLVRDRRQADEFVAGAAINRLQRAGLEVVIAENFAA